MFETEVELSKADLLPSPIKCMIDADLDRCCVATRMGSSRLESDTLKIQVLAEFNHDPGSPVV
jgi:hypothetical protein